MVFQSAVLFPLSGLIPHVIKILSVPYLPTFSSGIAANHQGNGSNSCVNLDIHNATSQGYMHFCEDVELLHGADFEGHSLFSCDPNRGKWNTVMGPLEDASKAGSLWIWHHANAHFTFTPGGRLMYNDTKTAPIQLRLEDFPANRTFHPLGTRFDADTGRLFVVNHAREASAIEIFQLHKDGSSVRIKHLHTLQDPLATHTPNSVVVLPGNRLYVTQDHFVSKRSPGVKQLTETYKAILGERRAYLAAPLARIFNVPFIADVASRLETLLGLRSGFVTLVEWSEAQPPTSQVVLSRIAFPNGITLSRSSKTLAVASTMSHSVQLFSPLDDYTLTGKPTHIIPLDFLPDNIALVRRNDSNVPPDDPLEGDSLKVTGHPAALKLLGVAKNPYRFMTSLMWGRRKDGSEFTDMLIIPLAYGVAPGRSVMISWAASREAEALQGVIKPPTQHVKEWTYQEIYSGRGSTPVPSEQKQVDVETVASSVTPQAQDQSKYWTFADLHPQNAPASTTSGELGLDTTSAAVVDMNAGLSIVVGLYARNVLVCQTAEII